MAEYAAKAGVEQWAKEMGFPMGLFGSAEDKVEAATRAGIMGNSRGSKEGGGMGLMGSFMIAVVGVAAGVVGERRRNRGGFEYSRISQEGITVGL